MSTYEPIASQTLGSAAASVTFSSIPQGYTDLILVITGNNDQGTAYISWLTFNNDTSTNYSYTRIVGTGTAAASTRDTSSNYGFGGWTNNETSQMILGINHIQNYSNSTTYKTWLGRGGDQTSGAGSRVYAMVGLWRKTEPITSIKIQVEAGTYDAGSTFSIYGIQVGASTQKAQGGNIVTSDGTYVYHTFTSSGSFIPSQALTVDYLVVAGGGGGTSEGGGGAGGLRSTVTATGGGASLETALSLTAKAYPVIVGAGGSGISTGFSGQNGNNSVFGTITSTGGGGGGGYFSSPYGQGNVGGSGGGGVDGGNGGLATSSPVQGYRGGNTDAGVGGGGGGGAGAVGANNNGVIGGAGGAGVAVSISGSSITYAGGGGAGSRNDSNNFVAGGAGGSGIGGTGGSPSGTPAATSGTIGTGSGGGGAGGAATMRLGGNGGSGIVVIRYAI